MQFLKKRWGELYTKRPEPDRGSTMLQCRPIEDFFKVLASHFYRQNWLAEATEALKKRIRRCVERIPAETVLATVQAVRKKLLRAYRLGFFKFYH